MNELNGRRYVLGKHHGRRLAEETQQTAIPRHLPRGRRVGKWRRPCQARASVSQRRSLVLTN